MGQLMERAIDTERGDAIAANAAALGETVQLRKFRVEIKCGKSVAMSFEAMGRDSMTVAEQHRGLCAPGQYVKVTLLVSAPTPEDYRDALNAHDWWFAYSDDHGVYCKGRDSQQRLQAMQRALDADYAIWNSAAPVEFRVGAVA